MATKLAALLKTNMGLPNMAEEVRKGGRNKDTILAHINPREAKLLKAHGGSGKTNPNTGLPEFDDGEDLSLDPAVNGEQQAQTYQQQNPAPQDAVANAPATVAQPNQPQPAVNETPAESNRLDSLAKGLTTNQSLSSPAPQQTQQPQQPGVMDQIKGVGNKVMSGVQDLSKALGTTPGGLMKTGVMGLGAYQANQNSKAMQDTANANEAQIKSLAAPYQQQGQALLDAGKAGQLTGSQQQQLQALKAQMAQQAATSGQTGGTGQQQIDATIQRMSQQFADDNIKQGMALMQIGDKYIQDAISTGYLQNKDAMALSADFYKYLANAVPGMTFDSNGNPVDASGKPITGAK